MGLPPILGPWIGRAWFGPKRVGFGVSPAAPAGWVAVFTAPLFALLIHWLIPRADMQIVGMLAVGMLLVLVALTYSPDP